MLLGFFWRDWVRIVKGLGRSLRDRQIAPDDTDAKLGWLLVVGTIPAGILGLLLEHSLRNLFASAGVGRGVPDRSTARCSTAPSACAAGRHVPTTGRATPTRASPG